MCLLHTFLFRLLSACIEGSAVTKLYLTAWIYPAHSIVLDNMSCINSEEALLIMLRRMAYQRFIDMEEEFKMDYTTLCRTFNECVDYVGHHKHLLLFDNLDYFVPWF